MRLYWERNAQLTFAVLLVCLLLSAFAHPLEWRLLVGTGVGGILIYGGLVANERERAFFAAVLFLAGILVGVGAMAASDVMRGALMWVQGIGSLFVSFTGCMVFARALREESDEKS
jgi:hypothetical protein